MTAGGDLAKQCSMTGFALGIDCGATTCRMALKANGRVLSGSGAGGNATTDFEACSDTILTQLDGLARQASLDPGTLRKIPTHAAVAGVVTAELKDALATALGVGPKWVISDERPAALRGALGKEDGVVVVLGTGSFVARQGNGRLVAAVGGHGLVLGDDASGAWLGREALRSTMQATDGIIEASGMTIAMLDRFGDAAGVVRFATRAGPSDFAQLAPEVITAAHADDPVARALMMRGAEYISECLQAVGWLPSQPWVPSGGVGLSFLPYLSMSLQSHHRAGLGSVLDGALALAEEIR